MAAVLEHLTGRCRGQFSWITTRDAAAWITPGERFVIADPAEARTGEQVARIRQNANHFEIEATPDCTLWINREPITRAVLAHGDMIEFGETGPLSRIRVYDERHHPNVTISQIVSDARSYLRASRKTPLRRGANAVATVIRRILFETTVLFRMTVFAALCVGGVLGYLQYRANVDFRTALADTTLQNDALAAALSQAQQEALHPGDLDQLRADLRASVSENADRLAQLEAQGGAATKVIAEATGAVAFIQGGYGLRHRATGRMLRRVMGPDGLPQMSRTGQPMLSLDGDGPIAEVQYTGTGFLLDDTGLLATNRHVALPWENNPGAMAGSDKMEPVMIRYQAYFPGQAAPVVLSTVAVSDAVDLAFARMEGAVPDRDGLRLAPAPPDPGAAVIVMGYPTGLRSLLAQSGEAFLAQLQAGGETGFWAVAQQLAEAELIAPLSSRGIVGRAGETTIVYDAETTHGGSGGPVLDATGAVVAVNTAIIPEFGGSNLGVPAAYIDALLAAMRTSQ